MTEPLKPLLVSTEVLASMLKIGVRRAQQLHREGVYPSAGHGLWDALVCVPAATEHRLQSEIAKLGRAPANDRLRTARAEEIELRIEERSRALVNEAIEEALAVFDEAAGGLKSDLLSIPARITNDLPLRRKIETQINGAFREAADRARAAAAVGVQLSAAPAATAPNRVARRAARHGRPAR